MVYTSLLSLLQQEEDICREIQTRINILAGAEQAEKDGRDMAPHAALLNKASEDIAAMLPKLHRLRAEIGSKMIMLEAVAADVKLRRMSEGCQKDEADCGKAGS